MKSKYTVEKRIADEHFIFTIPGIDYYIGDEYFVLREDGEVIAWAHTKEAALSCKF